MRLVLDASVAIAAARTSEPSAAAARARVGRALRSHDELVVPSLFGIEVAGALSRHREPEKKIRDYVARLTASPHEVVPLGAARARRAMEVALAGRLRGADAVYVWLASSRGLPLCTLDQEMAERAAAFCNVVAP
jgi:predicted nucleic acid-binding protein